ncbi:UDP-4-amino-4,6-dideoxy-N-acetyl-beta-L-altrosamine N-acetyltransferase [Oceanobacillus massiliensis]|uniref:UDP-4-amino-4, 6-dideoxy-N-acetyl-beta-L-altrosamine N-acetyltransferase n=1 Tax=Oceanobacillus massiliensis TaxID=1465765 RepID=UPI003016A7C6
MKDFNSYLRPATDDDLQLIYTWRNKEEIRQLMFNDNVIEWDQHKNWFNLLKSDMKSEIRLFVENNLPRGIVQVNKINTDHQTAEWGFYIGDPYKKGLGTLLAYHSLNFIFNELNIRKLTAQVLSINNKSLTFHQKVGFLQEGLLKQQILRNEKYIDVHLYGQFKQNWEHNKVILMEGFTNA